MIDMKENTNSLNINSKNIKTHLKKKKNLQQSFNSMDFLVPQHQRMFRRNQTQK